MISWDTRKLTEDIGKYVAHRLNLKPNAKRLSKDLVDIDYSGINLEMRFNNNDGKYFKIDVFPFTKQVDGLENYMQKEVKNGLLFFKGGSLESIGRRRGFRKYPERFEYVDAKEERRFVLGKATNVVSVIYKIKEPSFNLTADSFRDTLFLYVLAPILDWAQKKKA